MSAELRGSDLDILGRLRGCVEILNGWKPSFPERLFVYGSDLNELLQEAYRRFAGKAAATKLLRQFERRLLHINLAGISGNHPLPPFDSLHVVEPLMSLVDDVSLAGESPAPKTSTKADTRDAAGLAMTAAGQGKTLSKEAKALAALVDHPDWTDAQIAEAAGCNRRSLFRMKKFVKAKGTLKDGKALMPTGRKDRKSGSVEAWDKGSDDE